jgi:hypothetical protein
VSSLILSALVAQAKVTGPKEEPSVESILGDIPVLVFACFYLFVRIFEERAIYICLYVHRSHTGG